MSGFGWAIVGPGKIAHRFADAVHRMPEAWLVGVHGRDAQRADAFTQHWTRDGAARPAVFDSLDALLDDRRVQGVYVATPHAFHGPVVARCLAAGKPVLCEKSLVPDAASARELVALSRQRGVFLMEALWTRFLPVYGIVGGWLSSQAIGELRGLQSSFCFHVPFDRSTRLFDPAQAGGALLDLGVYNLSMTRWALQAAVGRCPDLEAMHVGGVVGPTGVDHRVAATLEFFGGVASQFQCGFDGVADNALRIFGERGVITVPTRFWEATRATLQREGEATETVDAPFRINGFEGEIEESMRCIARGDVESMLMSHEDSLATLGWMDAIRARLGVKYPFE